jgi:transposase, IS30 family
LLYKSKKRNNRRNNKYKKRCKVKILNKISIKKRLKYIEKRKSIGHFEIDTIVSRKSKDAILVIHERKTKLTFIKKLVRKDAVSVKNKIINSLKMYSSVLKTITYDNDLENALHYEVNKSLNCKSYFCNPYHSWEKGPVENVNGLIRRFIPKKLS